MGRGETEAHADDFIRDPTVGLRDEMLYSSIRTVRVIGPTVIISAPDDELRLVGWYHPNQPTYQAQVHDLIDKLGFTERPDAPGTYEAPEGN